MRRYRPAPADRLRQECLGIHAPDPRIGEVLEAAKVCVDRYAAAPADVAPLASAPASTAPTSATARRDPGGVAVAAPARDAGSPRSRDAEASWIGLTALALGHHDAARALLDEAGDAVEGTHSPLARRLFLLFVARYLAWTGDAPLVAAAHWERSVRVFAALPPARPPRSGRAGTPWETLLAELAEAAESVPDPALAAAARARVRANGQPGPGDAVAMLPGAPGSSTWAAFALGMVEPAAERWHASLPEPAALLDRGDARGAASVVLPLVHGMLGVTPDAVKHRLTLRPRFPAAWHAVNVRRIVVGDAAVEMRYRREANDTFVIEVEQRSGAVPLRLILEPELPVSDLCYAEVDGRNAVLDARRSGDRIVVPVQIVLDHQRRLAFIGRGDERVPE